MTVTLTLSGKTQKGKNRIRENGVLWRQLCGPKACQCLDNERGVLVHPLNRFDNDGDRWIAFPVDRDFDIDRVETP